MQNLDFADNRITEMFNKYKDPATHEIQQDGVEALFHDLELSGIKEVILMYMFREPGRDSSISQDPENVDLTITQEGFFSGMESLNCYDIDTVKTSLNKMKVRAKFDDLFFKELYTFHFDGAVLESSMYLGLEVAIDCWKTILQDRFPLLDLWCDYLKESGKQTVRKDTCRMVLQFVLETNADLSNYNPNYAWPHAIDDFVDFARTLFDKEPDLKAKVIKLERVYQETKYQYESEMQDEEDHGGKYNQGSPNN